MHAFILVLHEMTVITDNEPFELLVNKVDESKLKLAVERHRGLNYMIDGETVKIQIPDLGPLGRHTEKEKGQTWLSKVMPKSDDRRGDVRRDRLIKDYFFEISDYWKQIVTDRREVLDKESMKWFSRMARENRWDKDLEREYSRYTKELMESPSRKTALENRHCIRQHQFLLDQIGYECIYRAKQEGRESEHEATEPTESKDKRKVQILSEAFI